jgi:F0F1-type ATP synthase assembly protein I
MSPNSSPPEKNPWLAAFDPKVLTVGGEVGCATLVIVLISVFGGIWLDNLLGTKPFLTISLVLLSAPLSLALTFWIATRAVRDIKSPPKSENEKSGKENTTGE